MFLSVMLNFFAFDMLRPFNFSKKVFPLPVPGNLETGEKILIKREG